MISPLDTMARLHGEKAYLLGPAAVADYDPEVEADYVPADDARKRVIGFTEGAKEIAGAPSGCVAAFTIPCTTLPAGLQAEVTRLEWTGITYVVAGWRMRRFRGAMSGVTLHLRK